MQWFLIIFLTLLATLLFMKSIEEVNEIKHVVLEQWLFVINMPSFFSYLICVIVFVLTTLINIPNEWLFKTTGVLMVIYILSNLMFVVLKQNIIKKQALEQNLL